MKDRRSRIIIAILGLILLVGGALSACVGSEVFGTSRSNRTIFDSTVVRWWNENGWESFAVVTAIGVIAAVIGLRMVLGQLRPTPHRGRTPQIVFPLVRGGRGETTLRAPALSHGVERDLESLPDVHGAKVNLAGHFPHIELRAALDVGDHIDLNTLPRHFDEVIDRMTTTTGVRPDDVQVTIRFTDDAKERQIA